MFNHNGNVAQVQINGRPYLFQGGAYFTNAEYDRGAKRWVPEPVEIPEFDVNAETIKDILTKNLKALSELVKTHNKVMDEYCEKEAQRKRDRQKTIQQQNGEITQLKAKVKMLEEELADIKGPEPEPPKTTDEQLLSEQGFITDEEGVVEV